MKWSTEAGFNVSYPLWLCEWSHLSSVCAYFQVLSLGS